MPWDHPQAAAPIGVTGTRAANTLAREADLILGVGTRLQDFTTGSRALVPGPQRRWSRSTFSAYDAGKHGAVPVVGDAKRTLEALSRRARRLRASRRLAGSARTALKAEWNAAVDTATAADQRPTADRRQVVGAVNRAAGDDASSSAPPAACRASCTSCGGRGSPNGYHMEYGFSCMGYEIAGGLGAKMALPEREVFVMVGDGSYMMMNSELQTSVMLGQKLIVIVLDNRGYGCINRLQRRLRRRALQQPDPDVDHRVDDPGSTSPPTRAAWARSPRRSRASPNSSWRFSAPARPTRTYVVVIDTDPMPTPRRAAPGGTWRCPRSRSGRRSARRRKGYEKARAAQAAGQETEGHEHRPLGHQPDRLEQRRHARARRRHAARDLPRGGARGRLHRHREGQQVPERARRALKAVLGKHGLEFVSGWYSGELRTARSSRRSRRCSRISTC